MGYIDIKTTAQNWGITPRRVQELCKNGVIEGACRFGRAWMIPEETEKPSDRRRKETKQVKNEQNEQRKFPIPRENPFLIHTNLYNTAGTAEQLVEQFKEYPEISRAVRAQFDCRRGEFDKVLKDANYFLSKHSGFYATVSAGILLSFCAIWKGDIALWHEARRHIYSAPCKNEQDRQIIDFWLAVIDSNIGDTRELPQWFKRGNFNCLPADTFCTARVFYVKALYVEASALASGKTQYEDIEGLGLMRTLPFIIRPMLSQAEMEKTLIPRIYLHLTAATIYHQLGDNKHALWHIDRGISLCIPDKLYGILVEYRADLDMLLDDRLAVLCPEALNEIKVLHKKMISGWRKLHNKLLERNVSDTLTVRERSVARLAAFGLSNSEIAERLKIEVSSVKQYIFSAMNKVGADKRNELGKYI